MLPTRADFEAWIGKLGKVGVWPPAPSHPGLNWRRTEHQLVLTTLRVVRWSPGEFDEEQQLDEDLPESILAEPLTVNGCEPLVRVVSDPAHWAFHRLSLEPQFFQPGLFPADAITRNLLRRAAARHELYRDRIYLTCCSFVDWLDEPLEDESNTPHPLPYRRSPPCPSLPKSCHR